MIEGIPDGWELVRVGKIHPGEHWVNGQGCVQEFCDVKPSHSLGYAIIRKIEKPKQYRPFANGAEAMLFWDAKVRRKADGSGVFRVVAIGETTVGIGFSLFSFMDAFNCYECDDGSPFGVEVQS